MASSVTQQNYRLYPHDALLARTLLPYLPHWVTPNQITVVRIVLTPLCVWLLWRQDYAIGVSFFLLLGFSDALDGSLARVRKQVTTWGMMADPVADKLLIGSVAFILLFQKFPVEIVVAVVGLEGMFLLGAWYRRQHGHIATANIWGKGKMLLQVFGLTFFLWSLEFNAPGLARASYLVLGLAMVLAIVSLWTQSA